MTCAISKPLTQHTNYVFVDYENIQEIDLDLIAGRSVEVFILVGHSRKSVPTELVCHACQDQVRWIASHGASKNALDLVLSYHIGQQALKDPAGWFHVLSKDKDYDALIDHLRSRGIHAGRSEAFSQLPPLSDWQAVSVPDRIQRAVEHLGKVKGCRPAKRNTLATTLASVFQKQLPESDIEAVISGLTAKGVVDISEQGTITYRFPE